MKKKKTGFLKTAFVWFAAGVVLLALLIIYPYWFFFVKLINLIGVTGVRNTNGKLQTPVVYYEHPVTKKVVAFVATIHIAEPAYYAALQGLIDSLKGYRVLFEGTGKLSPEEEMGLTPKEQSVAKQFDFIFGQIRRLGEILSLQHQKGGLAYGSSWVNTDIRLYDLIRLFTEQNVRLVKKEIVVDDLFTSESGRAVTKWFVNKLFNRFAPIAVVIAVTTLLSKNRRTAKRLILDTRNKIAFRGISEHLKNGNVVTIWGAAHLRGIEKYIKKAGFKKVSQEWFTAYTVRDYSLLGIIKKGVNITKEAESAAAGPKKD